MERKPVKSSNLAAVGHEPALDILEVEFKPPKDKGFVMGAIWQYSPVSESEYEEMMAAPSVGSFFDGRIKKLVGTKYRAEKIADAQPGAAEAAQPPADKASGESTINPLKQPFNGLANSVQQELIVRRFVKKPIAIEAIQFVDYRSGIEIMKWAQGYGVNIQMSGDRLVVPTNHGETFAEMGDWVLRGADFYPCHRRVFEETYDEVICA